ncbi:hypothetical protein PIB30_088334 [Stylosanthes scabra]|uniref:Uncharacterized protein n=1 Tax=Stylosanthes scabra TaxID=79078 RepID=A0ABU6VTC6_9FABA|nr:hypothetical protein [Stylosanthes scabra]
MLANRQGYSRLHCCVVGGCWRYDGCQRGNNLLSGVIRVRQRGPDGDHLPPGDVAEPPDVANDSLHCVVQTSIGSVEMFT